LIFSFIEFINSINEKKLNFYPILIRFDSSHLSKPIKKHATDFFFKLRYKDNPTGKELITEYMKKR